MYIKAVGGKIFGAELTAAEKKAMDLEIRRQIAEYDKKHERDLEAAALWVLHDIFGFGKERLKKFYAGFSESIEDLIMHYEMDNSDGPWLCEKKLNDLGINLDEWKKEGKKK